MNFEDRTQEIKILKEILALSKKNAQFTVIVGRRRIGKTRLLQHVFQDNLVYWFVSRKDAVLLASEFNEQLRSNFNLPLISTNPTLEQVFETAFLLSTSQHFTLIVDEFQNFKYIDPSFFSNLQKLWDTYKDKIKLNLIISGSTISLLLKIFQNSKEPLFGRANRIISLKPFDVEALKKIIFKYNPKATKHDLLLIYALTGGVPKYVESLVDYNKLEFNQIVDFTFSRFSPFIDEGKNLLIEEFGQDYTVYFSILTLIAEGKTKRTEIENQLGKPISGYLDRLEKILSIIKRSYPLFAHNNRLVRFKINDNFLTFWFRFFYKNWSLIEMENFETLKKIFLRDYPVFAGKMLEKYFIEKLAISGQYTKIGSWWDRKGENEIDIVALDEINKKADIFEVKLNKDKLKLNKLYAKSSSLREQLKNYTFTYRGLSIEDM